MAIRLLKFSFYGLKNIEKPITLDFFNEYPSKKALENESHIKTLYGPNGSGKTGVCLALYYYKMLNTNNRFLATDEAKAFQATINKKTKKFHVEVTYYISLEDVKKPIKMLHILDVSNSGGQLVLKTDELYSLGRRNEKTPFYLYSKEKGFYLKPDHEFCNQEISDLLSSVPMKCFARKKARSINADDIKGITFFSPIAFSTCLLIEFCERKDSPFHFINMATRSFGMIKSRSSITYDFNDAIGFDEIYNKQDKEQYEKRITRLYYFIKKMKPDLVCIKHKDYKISPELIGVNLLFVYNEYQVGFKLESSGVKKIVRLFDVFDAANEDTVAVLDEIDADIHDVFLSNLIDYYARYTSSQIFLTTHNVDLMNNIKSIKHSIDFLSQDNYLTSWIKCGTSSPKTKYLNGMVSHIPFNLFSSDFIEVFNKEEKYD